MMFEMDYGVWSHILLCFTVTSRVTSAISKLTNYYAP